MFIGLGFLLALIMGLLGRYVAKQKNRSKAEGFWLGFLFSIFGVIIVALLPTKDSQVKLRSGGSSLGIGFWIMLATFIFVLIIVIMNS